MSARHKQGLWALGIVVGTLITGLIWFALAQPLKVLPRIRPAPAYALTTVQGEAVHSELMRGGLTFYTFTDSSCDTPAFTAQRAVLQQVITQATTLSTMPIRVVTMMVDGKDCGGEVPPLPYEMRLVGKAESLKQIIGGSFGVYYTLSAPQNEIDPVMVLVDGWGIVRAEYRTASPDATTLWRDVQLILDEVQNSKGIARYAYEAAHLFLCYPGEGMVMKQLVIAIIAAFVVLLIGFRLWQFIGSATPEHGMSLEPNEPVADFVLTDQFGASRHLTEWRGKVVVLFFGYTNCPDVCPLTLAQLNRTVAELGAKAEQMQVVLVSVDPERDTPERLQEYLGAFNSAFIGLTGSDTQIATLTTRMGVYAAPSEEPAHEHSHSSTTDTTESTLIDHTATVFVLDEAGYLRLLFPPNTDGVAMAEDIGTLLK